MKRVNGKKGNMWSYAFCNPKTVEAESGRLYTPLLQKWVSQAKPIHPIMGAQRAQNGDLGILGLRPLGIGK